MLTPEQLSDELTVPVSTIYRWNYTKTGPTPCRVGKYVRYRRDDVDRWLESRRGDNANTRD
jgi:excisionase family DNA binding protein